jgi:hypothetical protein
MTDDTIKKIFETSTAYVVDHFNSQVKEARERAATQALRERYYTEVSIQVTNAINEIFIKGRSLENPTREFYESELNGLVGRLNKGISAIRDDSIKTQGSVFAFDAAIEKLKELPKICANELSKAHDLQDKAAAGELDKPRKIGTRPEKLRDIRNYVETDK